MNAKSLECLALRKNAVHVRDYTIHNYYFLGYIPRFFTRGQCVRSYSMVFLNIWGHNESIIPFLFSNVIGILVNLKIGVLGPLVGSAYYHRVLIPKRSWRGEVKGRKRRHM